MSSKYTLPTYTGKGNISCQRAVFESIARLSRCLALESLKFSTFKSREGLAYDAMIKNHLSSTVKNSQISREKWTTIAPFIDDEVHLKIQCIELMLLNAPNGSFSQNQRKFYSDLVNSQLTEASSHVEKYIGARRNVKNLYGGNKMISVRNAMNDLSSKLDDTLLQLDLALKVRFSCSTYAEFWQVWDKEDNKIFADDIEKYPSNMQDFFTDGLMESSDNSIVIYNVSYPRLCPPRRRQNPSYDFDDKINKWYYEMIFKNIFCCLLRFEKDGNDAYVADKLMSSPGEKLSLVLMITRQSELFLLHLIDLFCRNAITEGILSRYVKEIFNILNVVKISPGDDLQTSTFRYVNGEEGECNSACFLSPVQNLVYKDTKTNAIVGFDEMCRIMGVETFEIESLPPHVDVLPLISESASGKSMFSPVGFIDQFLSVYDSQSTGVDIYHAGDLFSLEICEDHDLLRVPFVRQSLFEHVRRVGDVLRGGLKISFEDEDNSLNKEELSVLNTMSADAKRLVFENDENFLRICSNIFSLSNGGFGTFFEKYAQGVYSNYSEKFYSEFNVFIAFVLSKLSPKSELFSNLSMADNLIRADIDGKKQNVIRFTNEFAKITAEYIDKIDTCCYNFEKVKDIFDEMELQKYRHQLNSQASFEAAQHLIATSSSTNSSGTGKNLRLSNGDLDCESVFLDPTMPTTTPSEFVAFHFSVVDSISLEQMIRDLSAKLVKIFAEKNARVDLDLVEAIEDVCLHELKLERDIESETSRNMEHLYDLYDSIVKNGHQCLSSLVSWASFICSNVSDLGDGDKKYSSLRWFQLPTYLRLIYTHAWYPTVMFSFSELGTFEDANHLDFTVSDDNCQQHQIRIAPMSNCRRPLMMSPDSPTMFLLKSITRTCIEAEKLGSIFFETELFGLIQPVFDEDGGLNRVLRSVCELSMPKEYEALPDNQVRQTWATTLPDVSPDSSAQEEIISAFASALMSNANYFKNGVVKFAEKNSVTLLEFIFKCLLLASECVQDGTIGKLLAYVRYKKLQLFGSWAQFIQCSEKFQDIDEFLSKVEILQMSSTLIDPTLLQYLSVHHGASVMDIAARPDSYDEFSSGKTGISSIIQKTILPLAKIYMSSQEQKDSNIGSSDYNGELEALIAQGKENNESPLTIVKSIIKSGMLLKQH